MIDAINIITGGIHNDSRGSIEFVNEFDMSPIKRFYIIKHNDTETLRGWRAHRIERRWFYVLNGSFQLRLVKIDNWDSPSNNLPIQEKILLESSKQVLYIPSGYATCLRALEEGSRLLVLADYSIDNANHDNYLYPLDYFIL